MALKRPYYGVGLGDTVRRFELPGDRKRDSLEVAVAMCIIAYALGFGTGVIW